MSRQLADSAARIAGTFARVWNTVRNAWTADHYHPEAHYMRGPGPKWHVKHGA